MLKEHLPILEVTATSSHLRVNLWSFFASRVLSNIWQSICWPTVQRVPFSELSNLLITWDTCIFGDLCWPHQKKNEDTVNSVNHNKLARYTYSHTMSYIYTYSHTYIHLVIYIQSCICIYMTIYRYIYRHTHIYIYKYDHIFKFIYIYIYIKTFTNI